jgi:ABC-type transport system involved in cytochrome bd biosynthesis fused ATPase/permease subunit
MVEYEEYIMDCGKEMENYWDNIMGDTSIVLKFLTVTITWFTCNDPKSFLLVTLILSQFSYGCQQLMQFMTQINRLNNDFNTLHDIVKEAKINEEPEKMYLSQAKELKVSYIDIPLGDTYRLTLDPKFDTFVIKPTTNILIIGPSGYGKSSLLKGLFGLFEQAKVGLNVGEGKNYYHSVVDYFQEIKEKMPSSKVTIRDYFRKEKDNEVIKKYLLKAWTEDEYNRIFQSIRNSNKSKDQAVIDISAIHDYDLPINEKLSGGQKSRLIFWSRGYIADLWNRGYITDSWSRGYITDKLLKEIIVLDEPLPDVDHVNYNDNIQRFFKEYENKVKIMVAHPCECKEKILFPMFDMIIQVGKDGVIRRMK